MLFFRTALGFINAVTLFSLILILPLEAEMREVDDSVLESTSGEGFSLLFTGQIGINVTPGSTIGFQSGNSSSSGALILSDISLSNFTVEQKDFGDGIKPLTVNVKTDSSDPGIPDGTGYIKVDMPTVEFLTGAFEADLATGTNVSTPGKDTLFGLYYEQMSVKVYSGNVIVFPH